MNWKEAVARDFVGWSQARIDEALSKLAETNDYAERLGFECVPDDRIGFGNCYFVKGRIRVWQSPQGWVRAQGTRKPVVYNTRAFFHTVFQALTNDRPFAVCDRFGTVTAVP